MNIFKEMALSLFSFESYKGFLHNKKSKVFLYGLTLATIYFLLTVGVMLVKLQVSTGGINNLVKENFPEFELKNGEFWIEEKTEFDSGDVYIHVDTTSGYDLYDNDSLESYLRYYSTVWLIDSEKMIIKNQGRIDEFYFSNIENDYSKVDVMGLLPYFNIIIIAIIVFSYIFMVGLFFFGVIFVAVISMIIGSIMKSKLAFGDLYLLGIYARTLPLLLKVFRFHLPFNIPNFIIINFGLSIIYVVLVMKRIQEEETPPEIPLN